jgi:hypothetical protein
MSSFLLLVFFICASVGGTADRLLPAELKGNTEAADPQEPAEDPDEWQHPAIQIRIEPEQDAVVVYLSDEQRLTGPEMLQGSSSATRDGRSGIQDHSEHPR